MKFIGQPNLTVFDHRTKRVLVKFDNKGEFETEDKELIKRLKVHFQIKEEKPKSKKG